MDPNAATRLCNLRREQGLEEDGREVRALYDTFTEGFETSDLVAARDLLQSFP